MARRGREAPTLLHYVEYFIGCAARDLSRLVPLDTASNAIGGFARLVGPRLGWSGRVRTNLRFIWPEMPARERERLVAGVCETSCRILCDYWNLDRIRAELEERVELVGGEHLETLRRSGKPGILFSAHTGNWEMIPLAARRHGMAVAVVNRTINNPLVGAEVKRVQNRNGTEVIFKGREGARRIAALVAGGGHVLLLVDVRLGAGVAVPFMGRTAMTPSAPASLALRHGALLVPVRTERIGAARFRVTVEPPRPPDDTGDRIADVRSTMTWANERISEWIRARPEQWFWFHWRWGKNPERGEEAVAERAGRRPDQSGIGPATSEGSRRS